MLRKPTAKRTNPAALAILCIVILTAASFVEKTNLVLASKYEHTSLYAASYISGPWAKWSWNPTPSYSTTEGYTMGNIILVNPTSSSFSNLSLSIQIDSSETINPLLRLWDSNYMLKEPNSSIQSDYIIEDIQKFSTQITSFNIGPNQKESICLDFPTSIWFQFYSHNLKISVSQNSFGDIINGQSLVVPQTEAYLQIVNFGAIESDKGTYHQYYNSTLQSEMVTIACNPNFYQRYYNISEYDVYSGNFGLTHDMGSTDGTYFNVTVFNNSTFPVNSITLFGQIPSRGSYVNSWAALRDYTMQPNETYLFPVSSTDFPSFAYVSGYIANKSAPPQPTQTPNQGPSQIFLLPPLVFVAAAIIMILSLLLFKKHRENSKTEISFVYFTRGISVTNSKNYLIVLN